MLAGCDLRGLSAKCPQSQGDTAFLRTTADVAEASGEEKCGLSRIFIRINRVFLPPESPATPAFTGEKRYHTGTAALR